MHDGKDGRTEEQPPTPVSDSHTTSQGRQLRAGGQREVYTGVMWPHAEKRLEPPAAGGGKEGSPPIPGPTSGSFGGIGPH